MSGSGFHIPTVFAHGGWFGLCFIHSLGLFLPDLPRVIPSATVNVH